MNILVSIFYVAAVAAHAYYGCLMILVIMQGDGLYWLHHIVEFYGIFIGSGVAIFFMFGQDAGSDSRIANSLFFIGHMGAMLWSGLVVVFTGATAGLAILYLGATSVEGFVFFAVEIALALRIWLEQ